MYRVVKSSESINAMSIINPSLCKNSRVQIEIEQRDEGPIPHMHVYLDKTRDPANCAYIRLDKPEYSAHHGKNQRKQSKKMRPKEKADFLRVMTTVQDDVFIKSMTDNTIRPATGYEEAVVTWKRTFGEVVPFKYDEDGYPVMPDYSKL